MMMAGMDGWMWMVQGRKGGKRDKSKKRGGKSSCLNLESIKDSFFYSMSIRFTHRQFYFWFENFLSIF